MYGPAVRCKRVDDLVERSCVNVSGLVAKQCIAPGHHGFQRTSDLISGEASNWAIRVTSFRMCREDRPPSPLSSRRPRREVVDLGCLHRGCFSCLHVISLVRSGGLSLVPTCSSPSASGRGPVKAGRRSFAATRPGFSRPRLDGPEPDARLRQAGAPHGSSVSLRTRVPWRAPPRRCGQACWRVRSPARCDEGAGSPPRASFSGHAAPRSAA